MHGLTTEDTLEALSLPVTGFFSEIQGTIGE